MEVEQTQRIEENEESWFLQYHSSLDFKNRLHLHMKSTVAHDDYL